MHVVGVVVKVKPGDDNIARFEHEITANHEATRKEPGNVRFDVLKSAAEPSEADAPVEYFLYEVYLTRDDFTAHQQTEHYLRFKESVADLMAEPRRGTHYTSLLPEPWQ